MKRFTVAIIIVGTIIFNLSFSENNISKGTTAMQESSHQSIDNIINTLGMKKGLSKLSISWTIDNDQNHIAKISYHETTKIILFTKQEYEYALSQKSFSNDTLTKINDILSILSNTNEPPVRRSR